MLTLKEIRVDTDFVSIFVVSDKPYTTLDFKMRTETLLQARPTLASHVCVSSAGEQFSDAVLNTSLAHLVEHLAIEISVAAGSLGMITGHTALQDVTKQEISERYQSDNPYLYRIDLGFDNDFCAICALQEAINLTNELFFQPSEPVKKDVYLWIDNAIRRTRDARNQ